MPVDKPQAPGKPGNKLSWTAAAKVGVGTSADDSGRIWYTLLNGILTEIYYPHVDHACIRDSGVMITDGQGFLSDESQDAEHHAEFRGGPTSVLLQSLG